MDNFQIFININIIHKSICFIINLDNKIQPIFYKKIILENLTYENFCFEDRFETILKKTILEVEKQFQTPVDKVNLMIEDKKLNTIDITVRENLENKNINKTIVEYLLQNVRKQILENHFEKKVVHIVIKKCFIDGDEYNNIPLGKICKNLVIETSFIYLQKSFVSKLEFLLKKHQIVINKIICTNYAKSLIDIDIDDLSKAGLAVLNDNNLNEVGINSKKIGKSGFFEKLFHIFS